MGDWCIVTQILGYEVDAAELSPSRQAYLSTKGIRVVDIESKPEEFSKTYNFIRAEQVFEHLANPDSVLKQLTQCLLNGGVIYISVPNVLSLCRKLNALAQLNISDKELKLIAPLEHINGFTPKSLNKLAKKIGLEQIDLRPTFVDTSIGLVRGIATWFLIPFRQSTVLMLRKPN